jgi:hypothetical protein
MKNGLLQESFNKEHVFKDIVDHFISEINKQTLRIGEDRLERLLDKQWI